MVNFSIVQKSQLEGVHRLDAEYYQPEYLDCVQKLYSLSKPLAELVSTIKHPAEIKRIYEEQGEPFLLTENISPEFYILQFEGKRFIKKDDALKIPQNKLKIGDVIMTRTGANYGDASFYTGSPENLFASAHILIIRPKDIKGEYLATYLNSNIGRKLVKRGIYGSSQPEISPEYLKNLQIPLLSDKFQLEIVDLIKRANGQYTDSEILYSKAEDLLLEELGLKNFQVEEDLSFVVNLSDVKSANRIDAEYFQPKYQKLMSIVELKSAKKLEEFVKDYSTGFTFKSENYQEDGIPLIRINNIKKGFIDLSDIAYLSDRGYSLSPKDTTKPGDIVLSMSGTIGMSAVIPVDVPKCSVNQRILRFTPKSIETDFLVLVLNSIIGSYQLERIGTGGVQTNISYRDIKNILIPILPKPTQQKIAEMVRKSHQARKKSKELLEEAKRKVEEMIDSTSSLQVERGGE